MRRIALLFILIQGCHLGPRYQIPESPIPSEWKVESTDLGPGPPVEFWWEVFGDTQLTALEQLVVKQNPDLYVAMERVAQARAVAGVSKADLYPQISLQPSYLDTGLLFELYGVPQNLFPELPIISRVHELIYAIPFDMSYEVDIWGKNRGKYNSAKINAEVKQEDYRASLLMLTADLASNYFNLRTFDTQIELLRTVISVYTDLLKLHQVRYLVGLDSYIDVLAAIQQYENAEAQYEEANRQRTLFENAIAVLIGEPASCFTLAPDPLQADPPQVPSGIPSAIMVRRPDIASAERNMASIHALIGVAYASFYPAFNLTGALGILSPELSEFFTWNARFWQWGVSIFQTVFDGGRNCSNLDLAYARYKETEGTYRKTVLVALKEVEDALTNLQQEKKQADDYFQSWQAAERTKELFDLKYKVGTANQIDALKAQLVEIQAERTWVGTLGLRYQATVQFIKALGGSWDCNPPLE